MDVVDAIAAVRTITKAGGFQNVPETAVVIEEVKRGP